MTTPCEAMELSVSVYLVDNLFDWRNEAPEDMARKFVGGLGCAAIALLVVIETVVRGVLSLLASPFICCLPESQKDLRRELVRYFPIGTLTSLSTAVGCFNMLINSCTSKKMEGGVYMPNCLKEINEAVAEHFRELLE